MKDDRKYMMRKMGSEGATIAKNDIVRTCAASRKENKGG
jgi:hypothetical protein